MYRCKDCGNEDKFKGHYEYTTQRLEIVIDGNGDVLEVENEEQPFQEIDECMECGSTEIEEY